MMQLIICKAQQLSRKPSDILCLLCIISFAPAAGGWAPQPRFIWCTMFVMALMALLVVSKCGHCP